MIIVPAETNREQDTSDGRTPRNWRLIAGRALWVGNLAALAAFVALVAADGEFSRAITGSQIPPAAGDDWRKTALVLWMVAAVVSGIGVFFSLLFGVRVHRRLRTWLAFTMLVALWLAVCIGWPEIAWQGQRLRVWTQLDEFESIAAPLREHWPTHDGDAAGIGAYMAYPQGQPRMLLVIAPPEPPSTDIPFTAVERKENGALRFELAGGERGAWLEWHPEDSTPQSFLGGLEGQYVLSRRAPLGNGWYLVRYRW